MRAAPRLALRLLGRLVPETVTGDLVEEYASKGRSAWWFWRQTMSLSYSYWIEHWRAGLGELRRGWRHALRTPGFALGVVLLLGLAIGANATMFGWIHRTLLTPLPYPEGERLVRVFQIRDGERDSLSPPNFFDFRERLDAFAGVAAYWSPNVTLTGRGEAEKLLAATVSHELFRTLRVEPRLGRAFTAEDDEPGATGVAVLSHGLWQRRFGGRGDILGQELRLDDRLVRVIGVAPEGFDFPAAGTELWVSLQLPRNRPDRGGTPYRGFRILNVVARLDAGVSIENAQAGASSLAGQLEKLYPASNRGFDFEIAGLHEETVAEARAPLLLLFSAMGAVMLVACANVGGLLLTRTAARRQELALRMSLGASSSRLFVQLFAEGTALSVASGAVGLVLALWAHRAIDVAVHPVVTIYVAAVVLGVTLFLGLGPAFFGLTGDWADSLRRGARVEGSARDARVRAWLVAGEIAVALLLLVTASLLLRSFDALRSLERGFQDAGVYAARVDVPIPRYLENHRRVAFFGTLVEQVRALPGVEGASLSLGLPLDPRAEFFVARSPFSVEGKPSPEPGAKPEAGLHVVDSEFFDTLSIPLSSGRDFDARDDASSASVVIVNETMARQFWPGEDPVGRHLTHDLVLLPEETSNTRQVVGVVGDFRYYELRRQPEPQMYIPFAQTPWPQMHLVVRATMSLDALHGAIRRVMHALDADVPVPRVDRLEDVTAHAVAAPRQRALLVTSFAVVALVLAALGLYAVMSYIVVLRTHEIGIRVALGAPRNEVVGLVLRHGLELSVAGALAGVAAALVLAPWIRSLLFGVTATDPWSYVVVSLTLVAAASLATYVPARRAANVDPIVALRAE